MECFSQKRANLRSMIEAFVEPGDDFLTPDPPPEALPLRDPFAALRAQYALVVEATPDREEIVRNLRGVPTPSKKGVFEFLPSRVALDALGARVANRQLYALLATAGWAACRMHGRQVRGYQRPLPAPADSAGTRPGPGTQNP
jgi:hypothetical protein